MQLIPSTQHPEVPDLGLECFGPIDLGRMSFGFNFDGALHMPLQVLNIGRDYLIGSPCRWVCRNRPSQSSSECHNVMTLALAPGMSC